MREIKSTYFIFYMIIDGNKKKKKEMIVSKRLLDTEALW